MIYFPTTVKELKQALDGFPDDMPVGGKSVDGGFLDALQVEWVCVDETNKIVGSEAEDYKLKDGEVNALLIM